ncbi:MAG: hypothetical protein HY890_01150 [Deltaproteobacteria bacterium]|nr:hypothetical protein [Deltaproteobacteria bacterium]
MDILRELFAKLALTLDRGRDEEGQTLIEYVLVLVVVVLALLLIYKNSNLEDSISNALSKISSQIQGT